MTGRQDDEFTSLRDLGERLEMPRSASESNDHLEDVDELMARLRSTHGALSDATTPGSDDSHTVDHSLTRRRRVRLLVRGSIAAAFVAAAVGVAVTEPWDSPTAAANEPPVLTYEFAEATSIAFAPGESAAETLRSLSSAAAAQHLTVDPNSAQHLVTDNWLTELRNDTGTTTGTLVPRLRESWLLPDGGLVWSETDGEPLSADGRTKPSRVLSGSDGIVQAVPPGSLDPAAGTGLPTEPRALRSALLQYLGCEDDGINNESGRCIMQAIMDLSGYAILPPPVLSAAWEVLAEEDSVTSLGNVTDRLGRDGVGLSIVADSSPDFRLVLIVSEKTGMVLGTETILIKESADVDLEAPAIYSFTAIAESDFVSLGSVPTPEHDAS